MNPFLAESNNLSTLKSFSLATAKVFLLFKDLLTFSNGCFDFYRAPPLEDVKKIGVQMHWWSYYKRWMPQENFYYASKNCGFISNSERTDGTYSKYSSIDDIKVIPEETTNIERIKKKDKPGKAGFQTFKHCYDAGVNFKNTGDSLIIAPQFICEKKHIDEIIEKLRTGISNYMKS